MPNISLFAWVKIASAIIIVSYVVARLRGSDDRRERALFLSACFVAAVLAENSAIFLYKFYAYDSRWNFFVGHVPIWVGLIWPVVIQSALDLADQFSSRRWRAIGIASFIVFTDAALIEPVSVHAQLWSWSQPGLFAVPPIALCGWAYFTGLFLIAWQWTRSLRLPDMLRWICLVVAPTLFLQPLLLATWWGALRWCNVSLPDHTVVAAAIALMGACEIALLRQKIRINRRYVLLRAPAAAFFFGLLAFTQPTRALVVYAISFALPYVTILVRPRPQ